MNAVEPPFIRDATPDDVERIQRLADRIWRACYPGIISLEQIDYMLGWMYSREKILAEMAGEQIRYLLLAPNADAEPLGFAAFGPGETSNEVMLHKLYIDPDHQRCGFGSALLRTVLAQAEISGADRVSLRVNRHNTTAIRAYQKNGFAVTAEDRADIGNGFVMDDFILTRHLSPGGS